MKKLRARVTVEFDVIDFKNGDKENIASSNQTVDMDIDVCLMYPNYIGNGTYSALGQALSIAGDHYENVTATLLKMKEAETFSTIEHFPGNGIFLTENVTDSMLLGKNPRKSSRYHKVLAMADVVFPILKRNNGANINSFAEIQKPLYISKDAIEFIQAYTESVSYVGMAIELELHPRHQHKEEDLKSKEKSYFPTYDFLFPNEHSSRRTMRQGQFEPGSKCRVEKNKLCDCQKGNTGRLAGGYIPREMAYLRHADKSINEGRGMTDAVGYYMFLNHSQSALSDIYKQEGNYSVYIHETTISKINSEYPHSVLVSEDIKESLLRKMLNSKRITYKMLDVTANTPNDTHYLSKDELLHSNLYMREIELNGLKQLLDQEEQSNKNKKDRETLKQNLETLEKAFDKTEDINKSFDDLQAALNGLSIDELDAIFDLKKSDFDGDFTNLPLASMGIKELRNPAFRHHQYDTRDINDIMPFEQYAPNLYNSLLEAIGDFKDITKAKIDSKAKNIKTDVVMELEPLKDKELRRVRKSEIGFINQVKETESSIGMVDSLQKNIYKYTSCNISNEQNIYVVLYEDVAKLLTTDANRNVNLSYLTGFDLDKPGAEKLKNLFCQAGNILFYTLIKKEIKEEPVDGTNEVQTKQVAVDKKNSDDVAVFASVDTKAKTKNDYICNCIYTCFTEYTSNATTKRMKNITTEPEAFGLYRICRKENPNLLSGWDAYYVLDKRFVRFMANLKFAPMKISFEKVDSKSLNKSKVIVLKATDIGYPCTFGFEVEATENIEWNNSRGEDYVMPISDKVVEYYQKIHKEVIEDMESKEQVMYIGLGNPTRSGNKRLRVSIYPMEHFMEEFSVLNDQSQVGELVSGKAKLLKVLQENGYINPTVANISEDIKIYVSLKGLNYLNSELSLRLEANFINSNPNKKGSVLDIKSMFGDVEYGKVLAIAFNQITQGLERFSTIECLKVPYYRVVKKKVTLGNYLNLDRDKLIESKCKIYITNGAINFIKSHFNMDINQFQKAIFGLTKYPTNETIEKDREEEANIDSVSSSADDSYIVNAIFLDDQAVPQLNIAIGADFEKFKEKYGKNKKLYIIKHMDQNLINKLTHDARQRQLHHQELFAKDVIVTEDIINILKDALDKAEVIVKDSEKSMDYRPLKRVGKIVCFNHFSAPSISPLQKKIKPITVYPVETFDNESGAENIYSCNKTVDIESKDIIKCGNEAKDNETSVSVLEYRREVGCYTCSLHSNAIFYIENDKDTIRYELDSISKPAFDAYFSHFDLTDKNSALHCINTSRVFITRDALRLINSFNKPDSLLF